MSSTDGSSKSDRIDPVDGSRHDRTAPLTASGPPGKPCEHMMSARPRRASAARRFAAAVAAGIALALPIAADADPAVILATTTSTQDTGLLDVLVPAFERSTGRTVKTIAVGTGAALAMGERGDADVLLVHAPKAEEAYMADGRGLSRELVMHNRFIIVGPADDPAHVRQAQSAVEGFARIAASGAPFVSRADDSGTNKKELELWRSAAQRRRAPRTSRPAAAWPTRCTSRRSATPTR